uniref:RnaseH domain transposon factor n=1 Tax=Mycena chlorophos TaxID=658473 RepID=A0ABQ0LBU6_MYCCL|nr:RnaseH domain transposon factor [Mycena chlorophos]
MPAGGVGPRFGGKNCMIEPRCLRDNLRDVGLLPWCQQLKPREQPSALRGHQDSVCNRLTKFVDAAAGNSRKRIEGIATVYTAMSTRDFSTLGAGAAAHIFHKRVCNFLDEDPENTVEIAWSPGHHDIRGNERADELAKAGTELASTATGTRANALRRAKERVQKTWVREWKKTAKTGHYAIANRIPPSVKPTKHFLALDGKREVFGRLVQCRIGHCFSGEYYSRFVPSEDTDCPCGEHIQTREHIICDCPRYDEHRGILRKTSRHLSLPQILGTKEGITALSKFLDASGAFTKTGHSRAPVLLPTFDNEPDPPDTDDEDDGN